MCPGFWKAYSARLLNGALNGLKLAAVVLVRGGSTIPRIPPHPTPKVPTTLAFTKKVEELHLCAAPLLLKGPSECTKAAAGGTVQRDRVSEPGAERRNKQSPASYRQGRGVEEALRPEPCEFTVRRPDSTFD